MRAVIQRVSAAAVAVEGAVISRIGQGLLVLLGVSRTDGPAQADYLADKIAHLRVFEDDAGRLNRSVLDIGGEMLVVSQFTLLGDCRRGRRPSFTDAAEPEAAQRLYEHFVRRSAGLGIRVQTGRFRALMAVSLVNDGPVTLIIDA